MVLGQIQYIINDYVPRNCLTSADSALSVTFKNSILSLSFSVGFTFFLLHFEIK